MVAPNGDSPAINLKLNCIPRRNRRPWPFQLPTAIRRAVAKIPQGAACALRRRGLPSAIVRISSNAPRRNPEHPRCREGIDRPSLPAGDFISEVMDITVMNSAQGNRELVAHLESDCPRLSESKMVCIGGASPADQARLRCHEFKVGFAAKPTSFAERQLAFIGPGGNCLGLSMCRSQGGVMDR